jgi:hypothetical protein
LYNFPKRILFAENLHICVLIGHVARMGEKRNARRILMGKPEGKRPLGRPRRRWGTILKWIFDR